MKKFLLLLSVCISTLSYAQSKTSFGVRGGITSSGMRGDAVNNLNNLLNFSNGMITTKDVMGFYGGVYADIPVTNIISVEPGLYYSQKGYELKGALNLKGLDFFGANAIAKLQSQYIDMPLLLKANMGGLQIFAGPQLSYLAHADLKTTAGVLGFNILNTKMDATSQFNPWDIAATAGIGYQFTNGMHIMASYDYGLVKVDANKNVNSYNRGAKIGIGFNF